MLFLVVVCVLVVWWFAFWFVWIVGGVFECWLFGWLIWLLGGFAVLWFKGFGLL